MVFFLKVGNASHVREVEKIRALLRNIFYKTKLEF